MSIETDAPIPESKLDVIRKLLAKAERAATPEEAEAYNEKAAALMARYGVDAALLANSGERRDEIGQRDIPITDPYSRDKATLLSWIAHALRCRTVLWHNRQVRGGVAKVTVFGYESDIERIEVLFTSLLLQATREVVRQNPPYWSDESTAAFRRSWLNGFSAAVATRLREAEARAAAQHDETAAAGTPGAALVLADRKSIVDRAYVDAFPGMRTTQPRQLSGSGRGAGIDAGRRADLGGPRLGPAARRALNG